MIHAAFPSPEQGVWYLGAFPLRAYALCILAGIAVAVAIGNRRFVARGGLPGQVADVAVWAVPFGVVGGRAYHVLTDWDAYFGEGGKGFLGALRIWEGGLGIWGAIALGFLGAWIGCKRLDVPFVPFADAVAPGIAMAQAIGRWGNYFNQELFGKPTTMPWGLEIDPVNRPAGFESFQTFHPVFLYESLACIVIALVLVWADARFKMGHGRVFALYVSLYCLFRGPIENMRIDDAHHILGVRLNVFTSLIVGAIALSYFVRSSERYRGREFMRDGQILAGRRRADVPPASSGGKRRAEPAPATTPSDSDRTPGEAKRGKPAKPTKPATAEEMAREAAAVSADVSRLLEEIQAARAKGSQVTPTMSVPPAAPRKPADVAPTLPTATPTPPPIAAPPIVAPPAPDSSPADKPRGRRLKGR